MSTVKFRVSRYVDGDGRVREAEMVVGDDQLWLSAATPGTGTRRVTAPSSSS
jgi:hypothetical protein